MRYWRKIGNGPCVCYVRGGEPVRRMATVNLVVEERGIIGIRTTANNKCAGKAETMG